MQVLISGNAASCAARVRPAGPPPTIRTSTSSGSDPEAPEATCRSAGSNTPGSPGSKPLRWNCIGSVLPILANDIAQYADHQYTSQAPLLRRSSVKDNYEMPGHLVRRFQQI